MMSYDMMGVSMGNWMLFGMVFLIALISGLVLLVIWTVRRGRK